MKVLVTGHRGYIGSVMVPILLQAGHAVQGLDSGLYRRCAYAPGGVSAQVPSQEKDIRDVRPSDLTGFDAVIHLAALSNDPLSNLDPEVTYAINHKGAVRVATAAKAAGVKRFLFASSCSNYGLSGADLIDENGALNPVSAYGHSKVRAEHDIAALGDADFTPVFLRPATAYGLSPMLRFDIVLNNLVAWAVTQNVVHMKSDGTPWRPIVHVRDISSAFLAALEAPSERIHNQAFNVGQTEHNYQIRQIAEVVAATVPGCRLEYADDAGPDPRSYRVDFSKIARVLPAFRPQWDVVAGAKELFEAYTGSGLTLSDFEGPRYQRISHIRQLLETETIDSSLRWPEAVLPARVSA